MGSQPSRAVMDKAEDTDASCYYCCMRRIPSSEVVDEARRAQDVTMFLLEFAPINGQNSSGSTDGAGDAVQRQERTVKFFAKNVDEVVPQECPVEQSAGSAGDSPATMPESSSRLGLDEPELAQIVSLVAANAGVTNEEQGVFGACLTVETRDFRPGQRSEDVAPFPDLNFVPDTCWQSPVVLASEDSITDDRTDDSSHFRGRVFGSPAPSASYQDAQYRLFGSIENDVSAEVSVRTEYTPRGSTDMIERAASTDATSDDTGDSPEGSEPGDFMAPRPELNQEMLGGEDFFTANGSLPDPEPMEIDDDDFYIERDENDNAEHECGSPCEIVVTVEVTTDCANDCSPLSEAENRIASYPDVVPTATAAKEQFQPTFCSDIGFSVNEILAEETLTPVTTEKFSWINSDRESPTMVLNPIVDVTITGNSPRVISQDKSHDDMPNQGAGEFCDNEQLPDQSVRLESSNRISSTVLDQSVPHKPNEYALHESRVLNVEESMIYSKIPAGSGSAEIQVQNNAIDAFCCDEELATRVSYGEVLVDSVLDSPGVPNSIHASPDVVHGRVLKEYPSKIYQADVVETNVVPESWDVRQTKAVNSTADAEDETERAIFEQISSFNFQADSALPGLKNLEQESSVKNLASEYSPLQNLAAVGKEGIVNKGDETSQDSEVAGAMSDIIPLCDDEQATMVPTDEPRTEFPCRVFGGYGISSNDTKTGLVKKEMMLNRLEQHGGPDVMRTSEMPVDEFLSRNSPRAWRDAQQHFDEHSANALPDQSSVNDTSWLDYLPDEAHSQHGDETANSLQDNSDSDPQQLHNITYPPSTSESTATNSNHASEKPASLAKRSSSYLYNIISKFKKPEQPESRGIKRAAEPQESETQPTPKVARTERSSLRRSLFGSFMSLIPRCFSRTKPAETQPQEVDPSSSVEPVRTKASRKRKYVHFVPLIAVPVRNSDDSDNEEDDALCEDFLEQFPSYRSLQRSLARRRRRSPVVHHRRHECGSRSMCCWSDEEDNRMVGDYAAMATDASSFTALDVENSGDTERKRNGRTG